MSLGKKALKALSHLVGRPNEPKWSSNLCIFILANVLWATDLDLPNRISCFPDWWHFLWHYFSFELATICLKLSKKTSQSALEDPINPPAKLMKQTIFMWLRCLQWREALFSIVCIGIIIAMMNTWDHLSFLFGHMAWAMIQILSHMHTRQKTESKRNIKCTWGSYRCTKRQAISRLLFQSLLLFCNEFWRDP